jgi:hypothetical protein
MNFKENLHSCDKSPHQESSKCFFDVDHFMRDPEQGHGEPEATMDECLVDALLNRNDR